MKTGFNMLKPNIGLTKREFALIAVLLAAVLGYLLVTYMLQPVYNEYITEKDSLEQSKAFLSNLKASYDRKSEMESQLKEIDGKLKELTAQIPPYMSQEEAILLVDTLSAKDMLTVQLINFDNAGAVPSVVAPAAQTAPTADAAADGTQAVQAATEQAAQAPAAAAALINQDISISFSGSYEQIYSFLSDIENNLRKVAVRGITLQKNKEDKLTGQMKLSFVSYWDAKGQQPYSMEAVPMQEKDSPFVPYSGYSESATKGVEVKPATVLPDFYLIVNSYLDNAAKVKLYQYPIAESEVSADRNEPVDAQITINGKNGEFTYSYSVGENSKSEQKAIKARDGKIRMNVLVQMIKSDKDKVAVTLNVNNNSDMSFELTVKGDNKQNPRFTLGKTAGKVIVK